MVPTQNGFGWLRSLADTFVRARQVSKERVFSWSSRARLWRELRGKSVAIVGPAPMKLDYQAEIDSSEFVVRVGYEHWPWSGTGERIDAWVLDRGMSEKLIQRPELAPNVRWIFLKSGSQISLRKMLTLWSQMRRRGSNILFLTYPSIRILRRVFDVDGRTLNPNQVPMVLFELANTSLDSVSVYGTDFYLGGQIYGISSPDSDYVRRSRADFLKRMFESHDQVAQFKICKKILSMRKWDPLGSEEFVNIMKCTEEQFGDLLFQASAGTQE